MYNRAVQAATTATFQDEAKSSSERGLPGLVLVYSAHHAQMPSAFPFVSAKLSAGRDATADIELHDSAASRLHAELHWDGAVCILKDLGSRNGTFVNGARVSDCKLEHNDLVRLGDALFRFAIDHAQHYAAYRLNGDTLPVGRPFSHKLRKQLEVPIVGGYQVDQVLDRALRFSSSKLSCLIGGESGTGKELLARALHQLSGRKGAFVAINCAALPAPLVESELFGFRRGAFTGADKDKRGLIESAHHGTLFLDEVGDMPLATQAKMLRVLQEREVLPVGATRSEKVDVNVVCATHRNLDVRVAEGSFRGDLLARIRECELHMPSIRERREDIFQLVLHFAALLDVREDAFSSAFFLRVCEREWPYNVRDLQRAVRVAIALRGQGAMGPELLPAEAEMEEAPSSNKGVPSEEELRRLLSEHEGNIAAVGRVFGKERMQVHRWMQRYDIDIKSYRSQ